MRKVETVIIGAGVSGLSLAHFIAQKNKTVLVIEKKRDAGGSIYSKEFKENFWIELGAHTLYNSYQTLISIIKELNLTYEISKRKKAPYRVIKESKLYSIISTLNIWELLRSIINLFKIKKENLTLKNYYSQIVGNSNYQNLFQYAFRAVISQDPDQFPANFLFKKRKKTKEFPRSFTFRAGISKLLNSILSNQNIELKLNSIVQSISFSDDIYTLSLQSGETIQTKNLALATPSIEAGNLIENIYPEIAHKLSNIKNCLIESIGIVLNKEDLNLERVAGFIATNNDFFSMVSRDTLDHVKYRGFTFHFDGNNIHNEQTQNRINYICNLLKVEKEKIVHIEVTQNTLPTININHVDNFVNPINDLIKNKNLYITGNYFNGISIEDCVERSYTEFKRMHYR